MNKSGDFNSYRATEAKMVGTGELSYLETNGHAGKAAIAESAKGSGTMDMSYGDPLNSAGKLEADVKGEFTPKKD